MKNLILAISALPLAVVLAACGGGGDGSADTAATASTAGTATPAASTTAAKYAGTWGGCFSTAASSSRKETLVITAQGAETASFSFSEANYAEPTCAGAAGTTSSDSGTITFAGTKTMGTDTVDQATIAQAGGTQKQVMLVTGTSLMFGKQAGDGGTLDADGYPTSFEADPLSRL